MADITTVLGSYDRGELSKAELIVCLGEAVDPENASASLAEMPEELRREVLAWAFACPEPGEGVYVASDNFSGGEEGYERVKASRWRRAEKVCEAAAAIRRAYLLGLVPLGPSPVKG